MGKGKSIGIGIVIGLIIGIGIGYGVLATDSEEINDDIAIVPQQTITVDNPQLSGEVNIGLILPLTGDLSTHGEENWAGSKLGVIDFNKHLEKLGVNWTLKMISEDSATNPAIAFEKLTSLNAKGINIVVGPETSSNIRNVKGYADSNNMLLVSCCSSAPALAIPNDSVFRLVPDDTNQGTALAKLIQHEGIKVIVPVWRGDTWGDGLSDATTGSFVKRGGIVDDGVRYNPESPKFSASTSLLAKIVQGYIDEYGADKVAILFLGFAEILQFTQSASEHNVLDDVRWFGSGANTKEHKLIDDPIALEFSNNIQFTTVQVAVTKNPTFERVESILTEELGRVPNTFVHSSYDAVWLIGLTMLQTESTDVSTIKAVLPDVAENYYGAIGSTKLNEAGDLAQADYEVWGIRGGDWVLLDKYISATDSVSREVLKQKEKVVQIKEPKSVELTDRLVADLVKQYKGKDGKGDRLIDVLATLITIAYPNEQILDNPSSVVDWYAFPDLTKREGIYKVGFIFETYKENTEYVWYVDTNTNRISAGNSGAKAILDTLDAFD